MKSIRIIVMMFLAAAIPLHLAIAQQGTPQPGIAAPGKEEIAAKIENIAATLQLTPKQEMQMLPILKEDALQLKALKGNTTLGPLRKLMQLEQISTASDAKIMPLLNPVQQQKWQAIRQEQRQQIIQRAMTGAIGSR